MCLDPRVTYTTAREAGANTAVHGADRANPMDRQYRKSHRPPSRIEAPYALLLSNAAASYCTESFRGRNRLAQFQSQSHPLPCLRHRGPEPQTCALLSHRHCAATQELCATITSEPRFPRIVGLKGTCKTRGLRPDRLHHSPGPPSTHTNGLSPHLATLAHDQCRYRNDISC